MKYYIDTEFIDDGETIGLISIGIVAEDGREYYAQSVQHSPSKASQWVIENVIKHLRMCQRDDTHISLPDSLPPLRPILNQIELELVLHENGRCSLPGCPWDLRANIVYELRSFLDPAKYGAPELYGWCSGYDWVAFCQLFGTMMQLPDGYPHYIRDLQYELDKHRISDGQLPQQEEGLHNALQDARHIKRLWTTVQFGQDFLRNYGPPILMADEQ